MNYRISLDRGERRGSLKRRMIAVAALWIIVLLSGGAFALDRILVHSFRQTSDAQAEDVMRTIILSSSFNSLGQIQMKQPLGIQAFIEPYSGYYWQISAPGKEPYASRSLWDQRLKPSSGAISGSHVYRSDEFPEHPLRILERDARLPESPVLWRFLVTQPVSALNQQIVELRKPMIWSFSILGLGLILMTSFQVTIGLRPLRRLGHSVALVKAGQAERVDDCDVVELAPLIKELNALLAHKKSQANEARQFADDLAHSLERPLTVILSEATSRRPDLAEIVFHEAKAMRFQVDRQLARARATGRRGMAQSRSDIWTVLHDVRRTVSRLYREVTIDVAGEQQAEVHIERQDLEEVLGILIENAAKHGAGRVFVTVQRKENLVKILIEDAGRGIPKEQRAVLENRITEREPQIGGISMIIAVDLVDIYRGRVVFGESEDLGGLMVEVCLPAPNINTDLARRSNRETSSG